MKRPKIYRPKTNSTHKKFNGRSRIDRLYDSDWEFYRKRFLRENSFCYACGAPATVVDHTVPHQGDIALFEKLDNHMPLCKPCHDVITATFDRYHKRGDPITKKGMWIGAKREAAENEGRRVPSRIKVLAAYRI